MLQQYGGTVTWVPYGENLVAYGFCGENDLESEIAAEVICTDNATWSLTGDGTMTISGSGKMMDCHLGGNHPWIAICSNDATRLTRVVIEEGITYVGNFSFFDFIGKNITSLSLPSTLTEIATGAFSGTAITELNLPENLEILGNGAFASCYNLTSVRIPASVTSVSSFNKCTGLTEVWFEGNAPTFADNTFGSVTATVYYPTGNST